jgi:hypothetical protein
MKTKKAFKSIFLKTALMFFTFYFIVVIVFTGVYYKILIDGNKVKFDNLIGELKDRISSDVYDIEYERLSDGRTGYWLQDAESKQALNKDICKLTELQSEVSYLTSDFSKEIIAKTYLYDDNYNMIAKSCNFLRVTSFDENIKSKKDYSNINRYIDLDKYFSEEQKIELFKIHNHNDTQAYLIKLQGYIDGNEVIPEIIDIYENKLEGPVSVDEAMEKAEKVKTLNFNVQGVEGLKKIDINDYLDSEWEVNSRKSISSHNNSDEIYKKIFQRYNNFKEYNKEEIKSLMNERGYIYKDNSYNTIGKISYDYVNTLEINNHKYYLALKADYYPWEDIFPKAIPLYLASFIMVLAMTVILSKALNKTYEKQEMIEKNRRELTSAIAHELKTPLGIIRTYGEGIKEKIAEDKRDKYLDVIIDETYKMDKIVLEMLELSKMEAKAYELKLEEFCLNKLVEEILKKHEKIFDEKNIHINYSADKVYNLSADYMLMERVINNLLSNAVYHTEENKTISITLNNNTFNIENEGQHIPKDKINLIWDTFYRADSSRDRSERRTGIGLAIVKNILQLHSLSFGVENSKSGVKFWFKFSSV